MGSYHSSILQMTQLGGSDKLSLLTKITQLVCDSVEIQTQTHLIRAPLFFCCCGISTDDHLIILSRLYSFCFPNESHSLSGMEITPCTLFSFLHITLLTALDILHAFNEYFLINNTSLALIT